MKKIKLLLSIVLAIGIAFSCSKSDDTDPDPTVVPGPKFLAVKAVISSNCATSGCHAASSSEGGLNFESNTVIVNNGTRIKSAAVDLGIMPPTGQLSDVDKAKITDWINAGGRLTD
jgi:uncharacterized membrane protein